DIIDDFRAKQTEPDTMAPRPPDFESAGTDPFTPVTPKPLGSGKGYSLLDAAYSTLLKDSHLHKDVERLEKPETTETPRGSSDYGSYSLLERVATGGMAEVFRAKRKGVEGFEKVVAVKRILPHLSSNKDFVEMFIEEAKMVASLSHPNIVQIFDLGRIDETYYIAMEFVEGKDLRTILTRARNRNTLPAVDLAALIAARVSAALEYAHRHRAGNGQELRIVHRDVSPQNILVSDEGEIKLVDFGIAKAATKASHTDSGSLRGKLLYMSPEQAWGKPLDKRSDLFALGAVFFEILTGHLLFSASSEMSILERVREARFVPPSSLNPAVPIELEAVVMRLLNKNPVERYQDASEVLLDLDSYLRRRPAVGSGDLARFVKRLFELDA
ncbi:MAG TPA: serine/threonine-protein kinase, partial [Vicinamibacteria bacterium]|nr:serine/threonine-protein kinase [Vicinamibacteria bacterium]